MPVTRPLAPAAPHPTCDALNGDDGRHVYLPSLKPTLRHAKPPSLLPYL